MARVSDPPQETLDHILDSISHGKDFLSPDRTLTFVQVGRLLGTHPSTPFRWSESGLERDGQRVRLARLKVGGRWVVRLSDLAAFLRRLNPDPPTPTIAAARATVARRKAEERAERALDEIGI